MLATATTQSTASSAETVTALRAAVRGQVLVPGDDGHETARLVWNKRASTSTSRAALSPRRAASPGAISTMRRWCSACSAKTTRVWRRSRRRRCRILDACERYTLVEEGR